MKGALPIHLKGGFPTECFLIHGYTGCPGDFNELPEYLHQKCKVDVRVMLLKGHGQEIKALDDVGLPDILSEVESELKKALSTHSKIIIGGISFGAQLALYLASKYPVKSVFAACMPYRFRFPFNVPGAGVLGWAKKYWTKSIEKQEATLRKGQFFCKKMHIKGLKIVKQAGQLVDQSVMNLNCPLLTVQSVNDPIAHYSGIKALEKKMARSHFKLYLSHKNHNIFYTEARQKVYQTIADFINDHQKPVEKKKVAAIIPALNEEVHIALVLKILSQTALIDEIIVIDDGSTDGTRHEAMKFSHVKFLRNEQNMGKAYCMEQGVQATDAEILFFCDADLENLNPSMVESIIEPVLRGHHEMFIGMRNNSLQKAVRLFALNSGERALTRALWNSVPVGFKQRYRIEAGLNYMAKQHPRGYGWRRFDYYQTIKERKYGFFKGTILRWWMNLDVAYAYLLTFFQNKKYPI